MALRLRCAGLVECAGLVGSADSVGSSGLLESWLRMSRLVVGFYPPVPVRGRFAVGLCCAVWFGNRLRMNCLAVGAYRYVAVAGLLKTSFPAVEFSSAVWFGDQLKMSWLADGLSRSVPSARSHAMTG